LNLATHDAFLPGQGDEDYKSAAGYWDLSKSFRDATFQVVSITTTTGYCTEDFNRWPYVCRYLLVLLMFCGACAGSTGGGIKVFRIMLVFKAGIRELKKLAKPSAFFSLKIGGSTVPEELLGKILGFFVLYFAVFVFCSVAMSLMGYDFETAFTSVLACLSNIGPGLAGVGAVENYAHVPDLGKIMLTLCMLIGRLEIYAVLILLSPLTWRK
jgi:trk system potassium uptake protein TrkH